MSPEQVDLIRKSFDALWPVRRRFAEAFYSRFFELAPDARRLFPDDAARERLSRTLPPTSCRGGSKLRTICRARQPGMSHFDIEASQPVGPMSQWAGAVLWP
jgi:hypothetical protein